MSKPMYRLVDGKGRVLIPKSMREAAKLEYGDIVCLGIAGGKIVANSYNPNIMAPPEMRLLELSIWEDGYTMPCVCYYLEEDDLYEIVDGYHRYLVMKQSQRIYDREKGMLPVTVIEKDISNRMASTIRHNRARGMHNLELMTEIVTELVKSGMSDKWIMRNIGMDKNELLRFKQISGLAELFRDKEFGWSDDWSEED